MKKPVTNLPGACCSAFLLVVLLSTTVSVAHNQDLKVECEKTKQKIARIQSKMRQGYRASQGVKMEDALRRLRKLRSKYCR